jgi:hypothetical protein
VEHIAVMYAVLPFTVFLAPPFIGFLADKLGSYTKVRPETNFRQQGKITKDTQNNDIQHNDAQH